MLMEGNNRNVVLVGNNGNVVMVAMLETIEIWLLSVVVKCLKYVFILSLSLLLFLNVNNLCAIFLIHPYLFIFYQLS